MADLLQDDTDFEMLKYTEASDIAEAGLNPAILKNKKSVFNAETGTNDILLPMPSGGYTKIGEEGVNINRPGAILLDGMEYGPDTPEYQRYYPTPSPMAMTEAPAMGQPAVAEAAPTTSEQTRIEDVQSYAQQLQEQQGAYTLEDLTAAGYPEDVIAAAGLDVAIAPTPTRTEPLTEDEVTKILSEGGSLIGGDPTLREEGSTVITNFAFDLMVEGLRADLEEKGTSPRTIEEEIKSRTPELTRQAEVYSNVLFGTSAKNPLGAGALDFLTGGVMDIQEGYRLFEQSREANKDSLSGRAIGMGMMLAGVAEATGVGYGAGKLLKKGLQKLQPTLVQMGADAEQRIAQEGNMLFSNPVGPIVDRALAAAGKLAQSVEPQSFYVAAREGNGLNEGARNKVLEISQAKGNKKPKIEDLVDFFEQQHLEIHGRKLDPNIDDDFNIAVKAAAKEIKHQMDQAVSGRGWYDSDVKKTFETLAQIPGLERIADDETLRVIWSAFAAPTSIGNKVDLNTRAATAAFIQFLKTGEVPVSPPAKGAVTEGISGAGWGLKQQSVKAGMQVISHLIKTKGPEGFADWWLSPHTLKELTEIRKAAGLGGGPSGLSGGQNSLHLGAMVLGDKTGRYSLNINGYEGTTKDIWFSRSYNRHFGDMKNPDGTIAGGPRNQTERRRMEEFTARLINELKDDGLSEQDAQAILWFFEQNLFTDLGVVSRPGSFSVAAEKIADDLRSGVRGGDETKIADEQTTEGLTGFRSVSAPKRTIRSQRRGAGSDVETSGPYTTGSGEGAEGNGLLSLTPDEQTQRIYNDAGIALPNIAEAPATTATQYNADMTKAMSGHTYGAQVEIKSAEELASARLFRTENGSGFAIKPDGDIVAVFQSSNETGSVGYAMIQAAVQAGGRKLDAFDTFLPGIYETAGFRPVARLPWNDEFAPPNWNKETFKNFNNGEPDVVFFVYDPEYFGGATDVKMFADYGDAVAAQDAEIARLKETIDGY